MRPHGPAGVILAAVAVAALLPSAPAAALEARDRATAPLKRAAFVALPAVYRVQADIHVRALVVDGRRYPVDRDIPLRGTGFGVAAARVVTARHLIAPDGRRLVRATLATIPIPGLSPATDGIRAERDLGARVRLTRATTSQERIAAGAPPVRMDARVERLSDPVADLALLRIDDAAAPTLELDDGLTRGTPVVAVGFGGTVGAVPALRPGTLDGPRRVENTDDQRFGGLAAGIRPGDSGGPVLDSRGRVHGAVLRLPTSDTAVIARADSIRALLADGPLPRENAATTRFREAMTVFWNREYTAAAPLLDAVASTTGGSTSLAAHESVRAGQLAVAPYRVVGPDRLNRAILTIGALAIASSAAIGVVMIRRRPLLP